MFPRLNPAGGDFFCARLLSLISRLGQGKTERAPFTDRTLHPYSAAVHLNQLFGKIEAHAGPSIFFGKGGIELGEGMSTSLMSFNGGKSTDGNPHSLQEGCPVTSPVALLSVNHNYFYKAINGNSFCIGLTTPNVGLTTV